MFSQFLKGKTAVVTGSLSGIGLGIARALSAAGSNIVLNGFAPEAEIKKIEAELSTGANKAKFFHADMEKSADCRALVQNGYKHFGSLDILVNNAGIQHIKPVDEFEDEMWEKVVNINLSSNFHTMKAALPLMKAKSWGRIINIASVHGLVASVNKPAYVAAKHGVLGLTRAAALENAKTGVTINAICPGFVLTPLIQKQIDILQDLNKISQKEAAKMLIEGKQPSGDFSKPEDIGALVTFLCTNEARMIMGAAYTVDGGWTAQ